MYNIYRQKESSEAFSKPVSNLLTRPHLVPAEVFFLLVQFYFLLNT